MIAVTLRIEGPEALPTAKTEAILRRLPRWFGHEESLQEYAQHAACLPCFAIFSQDRLSGFASLRQHFDSTWEIDCLALDPDLHGQGLGRRLLEHCEKWLVAQGASLVQVKTLAATHKSPEYAATRTFYARLGFLPLEVLPTLWDASTPCLLMVKYLGPGKDARSPSSLL